MAQPFDTIEPEDAFGQMSENQFREQVVAAARNRGWLVYFHDTNRPTYEVVDDRRRKNRSMGTPGFPDLTMTKGQRLVFAELKVKRNKLTDSQWAWRDAIETTGSEYYIWRPSDWDELIEVLDAN